MGKRGPAKTPTKILKLRGSWRAKGREREPRPAAGAPERPDWLSAEAVEVWDGVTAILAGMGVLSVADGNALARYCCLWVRWRAAAVFVASVAPAEIYETTASNGERQFRPIPQVRLLHELGEQLLRLEQQFGLTPSARAGLVVSKPNISEFEQRYGG